MNEGLSGYPCDPWDAHVFEETYYGHTCKKCGLFYAFGCAPWEDPLDDDDDLSLTRAGRVPSGFSRIQTPEAAWSAAAEFTRERERQIAEIEKEIDWVQMKLGVSSTVAVPHRILARLQAALTDLKRGMRSL